MTPDLDLGQARACIGRSRSVEDAITPRLAASFTAMLAPYLAAVADGAAPLGLHWCLGPEIVAADRLGDDGHPARGDFLPQLPLPRRMWASGALTLDAPLAIGDVIERRSRITAVDAKQGQSGPLGFVTLTHELRRDAGHCHPVLSEQQTLVYRGAAGAGDSTAGSDAAAMPLSAQGDVAVDTVLLFRYSALTFNGHRIHYDAPYARDIEHYPGLVVHAPLQATLLLNAAARVGGQAPRSFSFRARRAAIAPQRLRLLAGPGPGPELDLRVEDATGVVTMTASAQW